MKFANFLFIVLFGLLNFNCGLNKELTKEQNMKIPLTIYEGKIVKVNFVDKAGRVHEDAFNYFFQTEGDKIFIKISEGKVKRDEIVKIYNKNIKIKGYKTFGLWDTDDPTVQSRVGDYIVIYKIIRQLK